MYNVFVLLGFDFWYQKPKIHHSLAIRSIPMHIENAFLNANGELLSGLSVDCISKRCQKICHMLSLNWLLHIVCDCYKYVRGTHMCQIQVQDTLPKTVVSPLVCGVGVYDN